MYLYDIDAKWYRCEGGDGITKNKKDYLKNNIRSKSKLTTKEVYDNSEKNLDNHR